MSKTIMTDKLTIALAQIAPVWLDRDQTMTRILEQVHKAAEADCQLVAFGEALLPGYPFWIE
ncbi:MAG: carbon-nitrogen hydrolase family protein, partial [Anaerolineae bacterium]|nr:carbon-nitrogen hydrolase family protein [Anaerolineae bacterium]